MNLGLEDYVNRYVVSDGGYKYLDAFEAVDNIPLRSSVPINMKLTSSLVAAVTVATLPFASGAIYTVNYTKDCYSWENLYPTLSVFCSDFNSYWFVTLNFDFVGQIDVRRVLDCTGNISTTI